MLRIRGPTLRRFGAYRWVFLLCLVIFCHDKRYVTLAWNLPLPGGSKVSYEDGILRIGKPSDVHSSCRIPSRDTTISPSILECIQVKDTGYLKKGYGAFCIKQSIPKHAFLGFYPGKRIVRDMNHLDHPIAIDNTGEYLLSLDGGITFLDGHERAQDRSVFSPVHLNHKDKEDPGCNCFRLSDKDIVALFTMREILVGEELSFDYGNNYWRGREDDKL